MSDPGQFNGGSRSSGSGKIPSLDDVPPKPFNSAAGLGAGQSQTGASMSGPMAGGPPPSPGAGIDIRAIGRVIGRIAAWAGALMVVFVVSAWVALPTDAIIWRVSHEARKAGVNITMEDLSIRPWGSATAKNVTWSFEPTRPDSAAVPFVIEELDVSFSVFKYLLFDEIDVEFEGELDEDATISGAYLKGDDKSRVAFKVDKLPLYAVPKLQDAVNAPVRGLFALDIEINAPKNKWAKSSGHLEVHCRNCTVGDGETKLYVPGAKKTSMLSKGVTIPEIDLGTLDGRIEIKDGKAVAEEFGSKSDDIQVKISGDITFKDPIGHSRLNLLFKIFISPEARQKSDNIDLLVATASPKVKMDPPNEGWMGVVLEGNFKHRRFRGIKSKSKAQRLREKREARRKRADDRRKRRAKAKADRERKKREAEAAKKAKEGGEDPSTVEREPPPVERRIPPEVGIVSEEVEGGTEGGTEEGGEEEGGEDEAGDEASGETGDGGGDEEDAEEEQEGLPQ
jgi:type II secretion system protein N